MIASYARSMMLAIADNDELSLDDDELSLDDGELSLDQ